MSGRQVAWVWLLRLWVVALVVTGIACVNLIRSGVVHPIVGLFAIGCCAANAGTAVVLLRGWR